MMLSHVRAHARTPGNEAADQLAKEVARDGTVSNDAMRALTTASTAHRRVRGESDQTSWQPPHQPHQHHTKHINARGRGHRGGGSEMGRGENVHGVIPCSGAGGVQLV